MDTHARYIFVSISFKVEVLAQNPEGYCVSHSITISRDSVSVPFFFTVIIYQAKPHLIEIKVSIAVRRHHNHHDSCKGKHLTGG